MSFYFKVTALNLPAGLVPCRLVDNGLAARVVQLMDNALGPPAEVIEPGSLAGSGLQVTV